MLNEPHSLLIDDSRQTDHLREFGRIAFPDADLPAESLRIDTLELMGVFEHLKVKHRNLLIRTCCCLNRCFDLLDHNPLPIVDVVRKASPEATAQSRDEGLGMEELCSLSRMHIALDSLGGLTRHDFEIIGSLQIHPELRRHVEVAREA